MKEVLFCDEMYYNRKCKRCEEIWFKFIFLYKRSQYFISVHSIKIIQPIKILLPRIAVILYDKRRIQVCLSIYSVRGKR